MIVPRSYDLCQLSYDTYERDILGKPPNKKNGKKRGHIPFGQTPPLNGSKGDICYLITEKSASMPLATRDILMSKARKITKNQTPWTPWIKSGLKWPNGNSDD